MKNTIKKITALVLGLLCVFACVKWYNAQKQSNETLDKYHALNEQVHYFMRYEDEPHGELKIVKAWLYTIEDDGVILLETDEGELHEFEDIEIDDNDLFLMVFDGGEFVGLWKAV